MIKPIFRQSHVVLIYKLFFTELIILCLYQLIQAIYAYLSSTLTTSSWSFPFLLIHVVMFTFQSLIITYVVLRWTNEQYEITDEYILHRKGIINIEKNSYSLKNLGSINLKQGIIGRVFNFGSLRIYSPILKREFVLSNIPSPQLIMATIEGKTGDENKSATIIPKK